MVGSDSTPLESSAPSGNRAGRALALERGATLRARLVARDERALTELIEQTSPWLLGITNAMLSDADEAEEVVLEAYRTVWDRIGSLPDDGRGFLPWLLTITRNRAIDRLRARRRRARRTDRAAALGAFGGDREEPKGLDEAATPGWHVHDSVHEALKGLNDEQRRIVELAYFRGLTHSEIAAELGIPMGTVKTRLRLAYGRLREALAPLRDWL